MVALPLGLGLGLGLAGCGSLLPRPAPALAQFTLEGAGSKAAPAAARAAAAVPGRGAPTLMVDEPRAAPGYDSARMVYLRQPQRLQAFAFHAWVAPPARMLAPLLQRAMQATGAFRAVVLAPSAASGACRLETTLVRLVQDFGTHPSQVRLTLRAVLLDSASGRVLAADEFDQREPAASDDPAGGAAAARAAA
ncbi:MAG: membrane integrity-associated transporter subunit PqiC, partial [Burkholderiales bacterium]|nr:membrane integrity-associated transporter subunit PqiC [Burkholderiales bacterium]